MNQDVVTFKSSWCRPRYFKNCIRRKCESSSIPTSAKLRWGGWNSTPRVEFWPEVGGSAWWGRGFNPPNLPAIRTLPLSPSAPLSLKFEDRWGFFFLSLKSLSRRGANGLYFAIDPSCNVQVPSLLRDRISYSLDQQLRKQHNPIDDSNSIPLSNII